jgi:hypothetical protein
MIQEQIDSLPNDSPLRAEKVEQAKRVQAEIRRLREQQAPRAVEPARPPEPPRPGEGRDGPPRLRPVENPDAVREWLKDNEPETYQRMMRAQEEGRRPEVMQILSEAQPRMEMKKRDPKAYERVMEMQKLERESMELAEKARRAPPEERDPVSKQLAETLNKLFDLREENRGNEVNELKKRVEALERELANRKANKAKIVEMRRRELLGERGEFDW